MDVRRAQVEAFTRFAHLYDSGVPLAAALELVAQESPEPLRGAFGVIVQDLYRGTSLADALDQHDEVFARDVRGILRAGEERGELGHAARSIASGLDTRVLNAAGGSPAALDELLERASVVTALHRAPDGTLTERTDGVREVGFVPAGVAAALAARVGVAGQGGSGAFAWRERVVRCVFVPSHDGELALVLRVSATAVAVPKAASWLAGEPALLVLEGERHEDLDARLLALAADCSAQRRLVTVRLPRDGGLDTDGVHAALSLDPDVVVAAEVETAAEATALAAAVKRGVYVAVGTRTPELF